MLGLALLSAQQAVHKADVTLIVGKKRSIRRGDLKLAYTLR